MEAEAASGRHRRDGSVSSVSSSSNHSPEEKRELFEFFGWVFHLGVNSIGHEYCHLRFLFIRGKYVEMYKRDPHENPGIKPIRRGAVGPTLMVEELGRRKVNDGDVYAIRFYNRLNETKKGEIACATAGEAQKWMEAFDHAKQQAAYDLGRRGSAREKLNVETEINLEGHRPRVRRYANELKKLIKIGHGPETLLRRSSNLGDRYLQSNAGDAVEANNWKCVRTINGIRIFEDVADPKSKVGKGALVKAVAVIEANADSIFEVILSLDRHRRYEWDTFSGDLELLDAYDGHYDVVYGTFDPKYLTRWKAKRDFVFSRQWFRAQDGTYTIMQLPAVHKKRPPRSGYKRITVSPSTWEVRAINTPMGIATPKCLVTQMMEIQSVGWCRWKNEHCSKFEKSVPYALLCQVSGLKEYVEANPALKSEISVAISQAKVSDTSNSSSDYEDMNVGDDQFYDAISADSSSSEESDDEETNEKVGKMKLKNVSWAIAGLTVKKASVTDIHKDLDPHTPPISIDPSNFHGSLTKGKDASDTDCWSSPNGSGFMIRGKDYLKDNTKVKGGDPLLELVGVDWLKVDEKLDNVAQHPKCLVQSKAGKKLPFVLIVNLQIPAKPNYSLVCYYASDRPVNKKSVLGKFIDGTDAYRDARFKLIPSIIEGYWMVKRAVGTKACLLGKAVTCNYLRQDNFLEIDVDIGSSSVARSVIGLVLGYVTSIVVDLAILVEAKEEDELPEYVLGTVRLNRLKPESALTLGA